MNQDEVLSVEINTNKQILSSKIKIFKTERFFSQTKKIVSIDNFALKISEGLSLFIDELTQNFDEYGVGHFKVQTIDKQFGFSVKIKSDIEDTQKIDYIIFDQFETENAKFKSNDQRVNLFLKSNKIFNCLVKLETFDDGSFDLNKLYYVSGSDYVNFPMLSKKQRELVEIENQNVLVQGVAGSGKTNICINKLIFVACKGYTGKVLYSTFSRGLLIDTKNKLELYAKTLKNFIDDYKFGRIVFLDKNKKKAIENRLGLFIVSENETNLIKKIETIVEFLENHIDYFLIEDLFKLFETDDFEMSSETVFQKEFLPNIKNHQLKNRLTKLKNVSNAVCFKEIYGMIFGSISNNENEMLSFEEYKKSRQNSFEKQEIEIIYELAKEYRQFQKSQNLIDNNIISYKLLKNIEKFKKYSLSILDEVQDFTEINLKLIDKLSLKMFCVGDALQMINPTYFSFAGLKRIMFKEDLTSVAELECNYRNNKKIVEILEKLGQINIKAFGTHSFVLSCESMDSGSMANAVFVSDVNFLNKFYNQKFENFTVIVSNEEQKDKFREIFKRQEVLTVSEVKGLERDTVLLVDLLSSNVDKWQKVEQFNINHKDADENSVYRYYFNLFYVGLSRAKHNIFVFEKCKIAMFNEFFKNNFECLESDQAYQKFSEIISKIEIDDDEIWQRIDEFIKLGQFDNAKFYCSRFENAKSGEQALQKIEAYQDYVFKNKPKEAGIKLWKAGLIQEAKQQFLISGDVKLIEFLESLESRNNVNLDAEVVRFFNDFEDNQDAQKLIVDIVKQDLEKIKNNHKEIKQKLKQIKEKS